MRRGLVNGRNFAIALLAGALLAAIWGIGNTPVVAQVESNDNRIFVVDDCLPGDPGWGSSGCALKPHQGDVPAAEFTALLRSPLALPPNGVLIGHPSWRNEPSYLSVRSGKTVRVTNQGGRGHTFSEVADFGGGFVAPFNIGLMQAPECTPTGTTPLPPGATIELTNLAPGVHKFQCCIHPWMRAVVRIQ